MKKAKATLEEIIIARCPDCNTQYYDRNPGWRDKPQDNGISFHEVECGNCHLRFYLEFFTEEK